MKYLISMVLVVLLPSLTFAATLTTNPGQKFLQALDVDGSGSVSQDEFVKPQLQQIRKQFKYMDKNHDKQITADEADAFAKEMRRHLQKMQQSR